MTQRVPPAYHAYGGSSTKNRRGAEEKNGSFASSCAGASEDRPLRIYPLSVSPLQPRLRRARGR